MLLPWGTMTCVLKSLASLLQHDEVKPPSLGTPTGPGDGPIICGSYVQIRWQDVQLLDSKAYCTDVVLLTGQGHIMETILHCLPATGLGYATFYPWNLEMPANTTLHVGLIPRDSRRRVMRDEIRVSPSFRLPICDDD